MEWRELPKYNGIQVSQLIYLNQTKIQNKKKGGVGFGSGRGRGLGWVGVRMDVNKELKFM